MEPVMQDYRSPSMRVKRTTCSQLARLPHEWANPRGKPVCALNLTVQTIGVTLKVRAREVLDRVLLSRH